MPQTQFTREESQKRVEDTSAVLQRLLAFRRPYERLWDNLYSHLTSKPERIATYPDGSPRANIFVPYPFANVRHIRATVTESLFSIDPPFETWPRGAADTEAAWRMQLVMELMALRRGRLRSVFNDFMGSLATYGVAAMYVGWDWDTDFSYDWEDQLVQPDANTPPELIRQNPVDGSPVVLDPTTGQPQIRRVQVLVPVPRNRPQYTALDIYDVLIDPDGAFVARMFDKTVPQLLRENQVAAAAGYQLYNPEALATLESEIRSEGDSEEIRNSIIRVAELWNATDGTFTLMTTEEDLTSLALKDNRYANRASTYAQFRRRTPRVNPTKQILAAGYNPFAHCRVPILWTNYTRLPGETFGVGVIEPNYGIQNAYNKTVSMIEDIWNTNVNPRHAYDQTRTFDLGELQKVNVPNALIGVQGHPANVLTPLPFATPSAQDYSILPMFQNIIEVGANVSDFYQRGVGTPSGNRTATGIQSVIAESNRGISLLTMQVSEDIVEPLLQMTASNIQQFVTDELEVRITDEMPAIPKVQSQFLQIQASELAGNFDFRIIGAAYMDNRYVQQNNFRMFVSDVASLFPHRLKEGELIAEAARVQRIPYPRRFLKSDEEVAAEQAAMFQQQLALAAIQGATQIESEKAKASAKGDGTKTRSSTPKRPEPTVDATTGMARMLAQRGGMNALGGGGMSGPGF